MSDEKEGMYFVWEYRNSKHEKFEHKHAAAIYRGMPRTGMGTDKDNAKYVFTKLLDPDEESLTMIELINKYPCPDV